MFAENKAGFSRDIRMLLPDNCTKALFPASQRSSIYLAGEGGKGNAPYQRNSSKIKKNLEFSQFHPRTARRSHGEHDVKPERSKPKVGPKFALTGRIVQPITSLN